MRFISLVNDFKKKKKFSNAIRLANKVFETFEKIFHLALLLMSSERTLSLCTDQIWLRTNYVNFLDIEPQIWLAEGN